MNVLVGVCRVITSMGIKHNVVKQRLTPLFAKIVRLFTFLKQIIKNCWASNKLIEDLQTYEENIQIGYDVNVLYENLLFSHFEMNERTRWKLMQSVILLRL
jgi:hypothetical protein